MSRQEAKELARWLAERGEAESISQEVREAIYILSPGYTPLPQISVEDLFSQVRSGPLAGGVQEEEEPLALKVLQDTLHSNLVPKLQFEDILSVVSTGPLAEPEQTAQIIPFHRRYRAPILGGLLAAAVALILFIPSGDLLLSSSKTPSFSSEQMRSEPIDLESEMSTGSSKAESEVLVEHRAEEPEPEDEEILHSPAPKKKSELSRRRTSRSSKKSLPPSAEKLRQAPALESLRESSSLRADDEAFDADVLSSQKSMNMLREIAIQSIKLPALTVEQEEKVRQAQQKKRLVVLLEDADLRVSFEAAYRMGTDLSNLDEIENFLRIKGGEKSLRSRLYIVLGDMYRKKGNPPKAEENYRKAIGLHQKHEAR